MPQRPFEIDGGLLARPRPIPLLVTVAVHVALFAALLTLEIVARDRPPTDTFTAVEFSMKPPPAPEESEAAPVVQAAAPTAAPVPVLRSEPVPIPQINIATSAPAAAALSIPAAPNPPRAPARSPAKAAASQSVPAALPVEPPQFDAAQLGNPAPEYPMQSRRLRHEGVVTLRVLVSEEGRARTVQLDRSSGYEPLDKSAMATVRKWRFIPARRGENAVTAWVLVPITFALG